MARWLRGLPWLAALLSAALSWSVRRSADFATYIHDEDAYVLQAQIFASGRLVAPPRPVPEAFEQFYVLGTPVTAGKYYPGQALALAPFERLGRRDVLPTLTAGATAGLLVHLVQGLAGPLPAVAAWLTWLVGDKVITWHCTLLSQPTSAMWWLLAITSALRWQRRPRRRDLVVVAVAVAADAITRPWSAVLLAATLGVWLAAQLTRAREWRQVVPAVLVGTAIVGFAPVFNYAVTGDMTRSPLALYTATTMPYDRLGFGHGEPPPRALPEDHRAFHAVMRDSFAEFVPRRAPALAAKRALRVGQLLSAATWRLPLVLAAILCGVVWGGAVARQLAVPALALHLGYSGYAFATSWNGYELEAAPLWAAIGALGLAAVATKLAARAPVVARWLVPAYALLAASDLGARAGDAMVYARKESFIGRRFRAAVDSLAAAHPEGLVVYVRYANGHDVHRSVVVNPPFVEREPVWIVHAWPAFNRAVLAASGRRTPVLAQELEAGAWRVEVAERPAGG